MHSERKDSMITAHAGSDGYTPNSISFIIAMLDANVDALELDCNVTEDGILYLNQNPVLDMRGFLTLDMAFELIHLNPNHTTLINVDCKNISIGRKIFDRAEAYGLKDRIILSGKINYGDYTLEEREQIFYNIDNEIFISDDFHIEELKKALQRWYEDGIRYVQSSFNNINYEIFQWIRDENLKLSLQTVDDSQLIDKYIKIGVHNVTTNRAVEYKNK